MKATMSEVAIEYTFKFTADEARILRSLLMKARDVSRTDIRVQLSEDEIELSRKFSRIGFETSNWDVGREYIL